MKISIRWKIILLIILPVVAIYSASILYHIFWMRNWAENQLEQQMVDLAEDYADRFDSSLQHTAQVAAITAAYIEKNPRMGSDQILSLLEANLENNLLIYGSAVAYDHYAYDPGKRLFIRYLHRDGSALVKSGFIFTGYDYTDTAHEYWNLPKTTGKPSWTEPYYDEGGGNALMVTYSVPFFSAGKFMGIALVDVPLAPIRELAFMGIPEHFRFNIITSRGKYVYSSEKSRINQRVAEVLGKNPDKKLLAFSKTITSGQTGFLTLTGWEFQEPEFTAFAPVRSTQWGFSISLSEKDAYGDIQKEFYRNILFYLLSLLLIIPGLWFLGSGISKALLKLNKTMLAFAEGDPEIRADISSRDEIGSLASTFNHMASRLMDRERKLFEIQRLLESTIEQSPIPIMVVDSDRNIHNFNNACRDITGFKGDIKPGMNIMKMNVTWKDYDKDGNRIQPENSPLMLALEGKSTKDLEMKIIRGDGEESWVIANGIPVKDDGGNIIAGFVAFPDITQRKKTEEKLRESEERFRRIAENAKDMIYRMVLPDGHYEYVSPASLDIFGYTPDEFYESPVLIQNIIHPDWTGYFQEQWANLQNGLMPPVYEYQAIHKSGEIRWIHQRNVLVKNDRGEPLAIEGIVTDVSQAKRAGEEKVKLEADLKQAHKMEALGTLAGGIAHDFNNILAAIIGFSELAREDSPESSRVREEIEEVIRAGKRARDLVKHILAFSRKTEQNRFPVKIQPLVEESLNLLRASIPSTIEIRQDLDPRCGNIMADPTQIHQVIMNLCTNAAQAMDERGGILEVTLRPEDLANIHVGEPGPYIKLTVKDTGMGIDKDAMDKIFDPYFTTKPYGKGSGMGLAVVHGIVTAHQGLITVESTPGTGTAFHVFFPESSEVSRNEDMAAEIPPMKGVESILVVDDEKSIIDMTRHRLERLGYRVSARTDSLEALDLFRSSPEAFDLVITDQTMPKMTGEQLAEELLKIRKNIPIILCTGFSSKMNSQKATSMGIKAFLMKPVDSHELATSIRRVLDAG
ncbi:MAG: PAS domain S-box protein [Proteobacteria bacterium]|nr:PAS domain S-box protein [Pseudomonadota bacterium]MBU4470130.1 PAS domain S-box protein [Pseudomonadota bacterium]MCG2753113.1 PAS domain S-box protein [Desulfobacteraceae bacterium]